ncbi:MAG: hypothetical protein FJX62_22290 [Alphaproteobacteria bacterium]|nr:hypothetical protein [Alphaproteobacteria bacterium]
MIRLPIALSLAAACLAAPVTATAQSGCPEGRTASGQCVNAALASNMRQSAIIHSQPKISYTHFPILPALDWIFRYPNHLNPNPQAPSQIGTPIPNP